MFNKIKTYSFTKEGLEASKNISAMKKVTILTTIFTLNSKIVFAQDLDQAGWKFVGIARKGLFWVCMFVSIYGLYLMVLKKEDVGKKIIVSALMTYIGSWLVPDAFILIRNTFGGN